MKPAFALPAVMLFAVSFGAAAAESNSDPASTLHEYLEAENRGDVPAALSHLTDDAQITGMGLCAKAACVGKEAIRKEIARAESAHTQHTRMDIDNAPPDGARARIEHQNDASRAAGIQRFVVLTTAKTRNGKIASIERRLDLSDAETQKFAKLQAK